MFEFELVVAWKRQCHSPKETESFADEENGQGGVSRSTLPTGQKEVFEADKWSGKKR